ncbi:flagellar hook-basal body protein [Bacillus sp. RG28]|uniref:Flagellar hook-basal body protein n=1 Tax=Gottfriedia endophytica TaxID=2820819 RepID=A0A940NP26_9BACI|nr:flagellar hook-basal body protein [Gottfriedia endophytica]MBP0725100.1 flagellar hook-basal body protein [Gottfriedia endophytica]
MNQMMSIASNTMGQLQNQLDVISNNIANIDTTGYKRRDTNFSELLFQQFNNQPINSAEVGRKTPYGIRYGVGAKLADTALQLDQGAIQRTERNLDMALLDKNQFFQVRTEENGVYETRYTRDGSFQLLPINKDGSKLQLSTSEGYPVLGKNGQPIIIDGRSKFTLDDKGQFIVTNPNKTQTTYQLGIVNVLKPQNLESAGSNLFRISNNATVGQTIGQLSSNDVKGLSGALEKSNVDLATEMTNLTITQKAYQFSSRAITMADQMNGLINGLR